MQFNLVRLYQVNIISAGFRKTGRAKWHATIMASGKMDEKASICQPQGKAKVPAIMRPVQPKQKTKVNLKRRRIRSVSWPKLTSSASLAVAPQDISISKKCESRA